MSRKKLLHYEKIVKMCQFYSDSSRFFLQPTVLLCTVMSWDRVRNREREQSLAIVHSF
jgi:hypothetical protein